MTLKQVYEGVLVEINKTEAPSFLLEDFNYLVNKAITMYVNKRYNIYDINQQTTDDLRVLKTNVTLTPTKASNSIYPGTYEVTLPNDYLHLLNCICVFKSLKPYKCYKQDDLLYYSARKSTSDAWPLILINPYLSPSYKRPYYFIQNIPSTNLNENSKNSEEQSNIIRIGKTVSTTSVRLSNPSEIKLEIRYGKDSSIFSLESIHVDYLKTPQYLKLTQEQFDLVEDTSQILEFPDYVCQEIINELVLLILENSSDSRLQTHIAVSQSVAPPVQTTNTK